MLGDFPLLSWKSREQQKQDDEKYAQWAFPYGEAQRDKLVKLLKEIFPKQSETSTLVPFLTCKELFSKLCKNPDQASYAIDKLLNDVKNYKNILKKKDMPLYLAVVLADSRVDERLEYPSAEELLAMAKGFEVTRGSDK